MFDRGRVFRGQRGARLRFPGVERLESRTLLAKLAYLSPSGLGLAAFGQTIQLTDLNTGNPAVFITGNNGGILRDDYPLGQPSGQYDPTAENERVIDLIASGPALAGTIVSGTDYGAFIPVQIQATSSNEQVGDPVVVALEASSLTSVVKYEFNGQESVVLDRSTPGNFNLIDFNASIGDTFEISILDQPAATEANGDARLIMDLYSSESKPQVIPTSLKWSTTDDGVDYSYKISGADLSNPTSVQLDWASGTTVDTILGDPIVSTTTETAQGTYNLHATPEQLGDPPPDATDLLVVADPDNLVTPADPGKVVALALADITLDSVSTTNSRQAVVDYDINNPDLKQPIYIQIFRSDKPTYDSDDPSNLAVGQPSLVTDLDPGNHASDPVIIDLSEDDGDSGTPVTGQPGEVNLIQPLAPDPSLPYVLAVVVDEQGNVPADVTVDETQAHFKIWVIADVTYGFSLTGTPPAWAQQMANALQSPLPAGASFNSALAFDWNSGLFTGPGQTIVGGDLLYKQILGQASALASQLGTNDVIDVQLIGHSRGSAVIGQAMQDLVDELAPEGPALQEGYYKLTFLDPHPANAATAGDVSIAAPPPLYETAAIVYSIRSAAYADPTVTVASRVNQVEDFYEQNSNLDILRICPACIQAHPEERFFNLQGDPSQIQIQDPVNTVTNQYNLSPLGLGHSDVWEWYMNSIIQTLGTGSVVPVPASSGGSAPPPGGPNLQQILYPDYIDDQNEANALVGDLQMATTDLDQGNYSQAITELQTFDSAAQSAPTADFSANSAPFLVSIVQGLIADIASTDIANINSSSAAGPNSTATVDANDPANNQQVSGSLTTGSQFSTTAQFSVENYTQNPDANPAGRVSQGTFDVQTTGIDESAGSIASVTFTSQVPTQQLDQAALSYFGDDGQSHTAAFYNGSSWVQVGPSGDTPIQEQDTPANGSGMSAISLPIDFDNNTTPAVSDLGGTVFALTVPAPLSLSPVPGGTVNTSYDQTITANGGTGNKTLVVSNITGSVPGLAIPSGGTNSLAIIGTPTAAGTVSFTVRATDSVGIPFSQNFTLTVTTADPSESKISAAAASIIAGETTTVVLTAIDTSGTRETSGGLKVAFGLGNGTGTGTFRTVTDNGDGTYSAVFTGNTAGNNTITATMNGQPVTTSARAVVISPGAVDPAESTVSAPAAALPVGATTTVTLTAKDSFGNQENKGGLLVGFGLDSAVGTFGQVRDNGDGTYSATFTATSPGTGTYEASIGNHALTFVSAGITVVPLSLIRSSVTVAPATVSVDGTTTVTLTARDADGTQESTGGFKVAFILGSGTGSGTLGPVTDNRNGTYTATFSAGTAVSDTILATIDGFTVTTAATITIASPLKVTANPESQTVSAGTTVSFVAAAAGSPAPTVRWQVSTDGGTTFSNVAGATSTTLAFTPTAAQNGDKYRAVFTSLTGTAATTPATLTVTLRQATLTLSGLSFTYDGTPHAATVITDPSDLTGVTVVYSQNNADVITPTQAGTYTVIATLDDPNYVATSVTGTLVISPAAPYIVGEHPVFHRKTNKHGKPVGKSILSGFTFDFSAALSLSSGTSKANYQVDTVTVKRVRMHTQRVLHPINGFSVAYNPAGDSVTLTFAGNQTFPSGGQITVVGGPSGGVTGASGAALVGKRVFTISRGGRNLT